MTSRNTTSFDKDCSPKGPTDGMDYSGIKNFYYAAEHKRKHECVVFWVLCYLLLEIDKNQKNSVHHKFGVMMQNS